MAVSERTKRIVWVRDGGCCAMCRERVFFTGSGQEPSRFRGEVAHIAAERADGPRGDSSLAQSDRNHENNLLLLCYQHHVEIDERPAEYSEEQLVEISRAHQSWLSERFEREEPWRTNLHNYYYLNVPRLLVLSAMAGRSIDLSGYQEFTALHDLGWELNGLMAGFKSLLEQVELKAAELESAIALGSSARGMLVSFNREFRTKNIRKPNSHSGYATAVQGDPESDPRIYSVLGSTRVHVTIDPRWITTTTAFVQFRPLGGRGDFAGLGIVNAVQPNFVSITPFIIGLPSNPFMEAFYNGLTTRCS